MKKYAGMIFGTIMSLLPLISFFSILGLLAYALSPKSISSSDLIENYLNGDDIYDSKVEFVVSVSDSGWNGDYLWDADREDVVYVAEEGLSMGHVKAGDTVIVTTTRIVEMFGAYVITVNDIDVTDISEAMTPKSFYKEVR